MWSLDFSLPSCGVSSPKHEPQTVFGQWPCQSRPAIDRCSAAVDGEFIHACCMGKGTSSTPYTSIGLRMYGQYWATVRRGTTAARAHRSASRSRAARRCRAAAMCACAAEATQEPRVCARTARRAVARIRLCVRLPHSVDAVVGHARGRRPPPPEQHRASEPAGGS